MKWKIFIGNSARKNLARFPGKDKVRINSMMREMGDDPHSGDIEKIAGEVRVWRRRVGNYRVLYEVDAKQRCITVLDIRRRTTSTY